MTLIGSTLKAIVCYLLAAALTSASNLPEQLIPPQYLSDFGSGVLGAIGTLLYLQRRLLQPESILRGTHSHWYCSLRQPRIGRFRS